MEESTGPPSGLFEPGHRILTVGDGDLTFSLALSNWFWYLYEKDHKPIKAKKGMPRGGAGCKPPIDLIVTSLDSQEELFEMYKPAMERTLKDLKKNGARIEHEIDAT